MKTITLQQENIPLQADKQISKHAFKQHSILTHIHWQNIRVHSISTKFYSTGTRILSSIAAATTTTTAGRVTGITTMNTLTYKLMR